MREFQNYIKITGISFIKINLRIKSIIISIWKRLSWNHSNKKRILQIKNKGYWLLICNASHLVFGIEIQGGWS